MKKILILSYHPAPYRDPLFNFLSKSSNIYLFVVNLFPMDKGHLYWNLENPDYENFNLRKQISFLGSKKICFHYEISRILKREWDIVIIPGLGIITNIFVAFYCILNGIKFIMNCDTISEDNEGNNIWKKIKKYFYLRASAFWVPGVKSKEYFSTKNKNYLIYEGAYTLDDRKLTTIFDKNKKNKFKILSKYNINPANLNLLMVGNLISARKHEFILNVFKSLYDKYKGINLLIIGDGERKEKLIEFVTKNNLKTVHFFSNISFNNLSEFYSICDIYVHSGKEPYSTALEYAAICGCPVISSVDIGAAYDYINHDTYKDLFILNEEEKLWINSLSNLIQNHHLRNEYSKSIKEHAQKRNFEFSFGEFNKMISNIF